ncbi:MAG: amidohydrolase family protein [Edaphocola sp.]
MQHSYYSATQIHDGHKWLPEGSIVELDASGTVAAIHGKGTVPDEKARHYEGILCPGFVNAHCHVELSHMPGIIPEATGLVGFLQAVMAQRNNATEEVRKAAIAKALAQMKANGIVAVGDIANGTDTLAYRPLCGLHIHTFVEAMGFADEGVEARFAWPQKVYEAFKNSMVEGGTCRYSQSIVPHAPYSVSERMFGLINRHEETAILSIHNEETAGENEYYRNKTGKMQELYAALKIDPSFFKAGGKTSLQTYLPYLSPAHPLILVHNTFMEQEDLRFLRADKRNVFLCLCPNANWYIERRMPPVMHMLESGLPICLGTDSLASNNELSIWAEVQMLQRHFPQLGLELLLHWATYNGAKALDLEHLVGSLAQGMRPGLVYIDKAGHIGVLA